MEGRVPVSPPALLSVQDFPPLPSDHAQAVSSINQSPPQWVSSNPQSSENIRANLQRSVSPRLASSPSVSSRSTQHPSSRRRQQTPQGLQPLLPKHASSSNQRSGRPPQVNSQPAAASRTTVSAHGSQTRGFEVTDSHSPTFQRRPVSAFAQHDSVSDAQLFPPLPTTPQRDTNAPTHPYIPPAAYFPSATRTPQDSYAAVASSNVRAASSGHHPWGESPNLRASAWSPLQPRQQGPAGFSSGASNRGRQVQAPPSPLRVVSYGERDPSKTPKRSDNGEDKSRKIGIRGRHGACVDCRTAKKRCDGEERCARCRSRGARCIRNPPRPSTRRRASSRNTLSTGTYSVQSGPTPSLMSLSSPVGPAEGGLDPKFTGPAHIGDDTLYAIGGEEGLAAQSTPHLLVNGERLEARTNVPTTGEDFMQDAGQDTPPRARHTPAEDDVALEVDPAGAAPLLFLDNSEFVLQGQKGSSKTPMSVADAATGSSTAVSHSGMALSDVQLPWLRDGSDPLESEDDSTLFSSERLESYIKTDW